MWKLNKKGVSPASWACALYSKPCNLNYRIKKTTVLQGLQTRASLLSEQASKPIT